MMNPELPSGSVSFDNAIDIGGQLGVDWSAVDVEQFRRGLEVEYEHARTVGGDWLKIGRIALDHLKEDPRYYTTLDAAFENPIVTKPFDNHDMNACIHVRSRYEVDRMFERGRTSKYAALLSIGDPGSEPWFVQEAANQGLEVMRLEFVDTEDPDKPGAPDKEDVRLITDFLDEVLTGIGSECVLIHCEQGISRSAAAAVIGWKLLGYSEEEAIEKVTEGRPLAMPNALILELAR